ncbi:hypothetical protein [Bradyrhizobium sp. RT10b]|uniref:hypothetical protein n=1 Tax=Bradyrhizobium sp. RT10b TaxID=3156331 RepID=UPI00339B639C
MSAALQLGDFNRLPALDVTDRTTSVAATGAPSALAVISIRSPRRRFSATALKYPGAVQNVVERVIGFIEERVPGHGLDREREAVNVYRHKIVNIAHTLRPPKPTAGSVPWIIS